MDLPELLNTPKQLDLSQEQRVAESGVMATKPSQSDTNQTGEPSLKKAKLTPAAQLAEERKAAREAEREAKRLKKLAEEERKRTERKLKKQEDDERRALKKQAEEEERRLKREAIEAERQQKKAMKERERLEKLAKREAEQKAREEKKQQEELEKQRKKEELERKKLEEEQKKEKRSITNFFKVKSAPATSSASTPDASFVEESTPVANSSIIMSSPTKADNTTETTPMETTSAFDQFFLPFQINSNVEFHSDNCTKSVKWEQFLLDPKSITPEKTLQHVTNSSTVEMAEKEPKRTAIYITQMINSGMKDDAEKLFKDIPLRYLRFYENRKPPYFGTFTKEKPNEILTHPFTKIDAVDYEGDSDYSEVEDEEGEDVDMEDDDEDEEDDEDEDDIDAFVETDDNGDTKRSIMGPLVPLCRDIHQIPEDDEFTIYFQSLRWKTSREGLKFPLDPLGDYWDSGIKKEDTFADANANTNANNTSIETTSNPAAISAGATNTTELQATSPAAPMVVRKKMLTDPVALEALKMFVQSHYDLSLATLAELAAKSEPSLQKVSRKMVKDAIKEIAKWDKKSSKWVVQATS